MNIGLPLGHHWVIAPVWLLCSLPSGIPVYWQNLVWCSIDQVTSQHATPYVYNWYGESCLGYADLCCCGTHMCDEQNWYPLKSSKSKSWIYRDMSTCCLVCRHLVISNWHGCYSANLFLPGCYRAVTVPPSLQWCSSAGCNSQSFSNGIPVGQFQLSFSSGVPVYLGSACRVAQRYPSIHWVNQWHSNGIPVRGTW